MYFGYVCGNNKSDQIWFPEITKQRIMPDLPRCFQNTVLVWFPCLYIIISWIIWLTILNSKPTLIALRKGSRFNNLKLVISLFQVIIYTAALFSSFTSGTHVKLDTKFKYTIQLIAMVMIMMLIKIEYMKGVVSSSVLSCGWLLYAILYSVEFRSRIITKWVDGPQYTAFFYTSYSLIFIQLVFCFHSDLHISKKYPRGAELIEKMSVWGRGALMENKECPHLFSPFFSRITFFWTIRLIWKGYKHTLTFNDTWRLRNSHKSETIVPRVETHWYNQLAAATAAFNATTAANDTAAANGTASVNAIAAANDTAAADAFDNAASDRNENKEEERLDGVNLSKKKLKKVSAEYRKKLLETHTSILKLLLRVCGRYYVFGGILKLFYDILGFLQPLILGAFIDFVESSDIPDWLGFSYILLLFFLSIFRTILLQNYWSVCYTVGQKLRTSFVGIVYRKATKLSPSARQNTTVGEIVNLMSVDAQKLNESPAYFHMLWSTPFTITIAIYMIWQTLGVSVFAGLGCLVIMVPINALFATISKSLQSKQMKAKDLRVRKLNEILNGIKVLKLYSWEEYFLKDVEDTRGAELKLLRRAQYLNCVSAVSWFMTPYLVALTTFSVFILSSPTNILDAKKTFVSLSLFNILNFPLSILPVVIMYLVQVSVSMKRLKRFLLQEELDSYVKHDENMENALEINGASFSWGKGFKDHINDIDLQVNEGKLVAVVGMVGSGKSSVLSALCGEVNLSKGEVKVKGKVAYVSQQAWIQQTSIRENILFAKAYNKFKYDEVVKACSLRDDFEILPDGDMTEIGEKGINLSGGQKQRVSLARSLYQDADLYLFDDPLSAVDIHVGNHIFQNAISNTGLLSKKTRILVTNNPSYLPETDLVVVLKDGKISERGSYDHLINQGSFADFIKTYASEHLKKPAKKSEVSIEDEFDSLNSPSKHNQKKLIKEETYATGNVKFSVFWRYLRACGILPVVILILFYIIYIVAQVSSSLWLSEWSNDGVSPNQQKIWRLHVYGLLGLAQVIAVVGMSITLAIACTVASKHLHGNLLQSILKAPMSFFDTTPLGRITNRFSRDIDTLDLMLPLTIRIWLSTFAGVFAVFFIITYSTPIFITVALPIVILYILIQRVFIRVSRQLRRLDSNLRSPIYTHFTETLTGLGMIRASKEVPRFIRKSNLLLDRNQMSNYTLISANRWLGVWLELIGTLVVLFAGIFAILNKDQLDSGMAGLSLSYALQVTAIMNMFVRMTSEIEVQVVSVERIDEYINCPKEALSHIEETKPPATWPEAGVVDIRGLSVCYRKDSQLVLDNVKCYINSAEKVGIVGRTGAGKSSLILALFRILEASSGKVYIDDVDISSLGLHELRSKLTVIPQDPVLFAGTLRMNLDPSKTRTDDELWQSLHHANLQTFVQDMPQKLNTSCSEGGENFSLGQRQLICLARALLRKSKVLLFDEATAAVDLKTDSIVQRTIKSEFANCTIITIAHRLSTIIDYDKIIVLESGKVREFNSPQNLLSDKKSIFYNMARTAGITK